jgi:hypothetical protein
VVEKAKTACSASGNDIGDHFLDITKMIDLGKGSHAKGTGHHFLGGGFHFFGNEE